VSDCPRPTLPASKRLFFVPDNVIVVATMNTSDRSVGGLDAALRRRFAFERIWPHGFDPKAPQNADGVLKMILGGEKAGTPTPNADHPSRLKQSVEVWHALNTRLKDIGPDALLGHSYLYDLRKALENTAAANKDRRFALGNAEQAVKHVWLQQLLPQLCEILDVNHQQRSEDLTPYNEAIEPLGLGVRLSPPNGRSVHGAVHLTRTA
jgi:hypothetical protein